MRIIVAGSRAATEAQVRDALRRCPWIGFVSAVVSGTARGADTFGEAWALEHGIRVAQFPADWTKYKKQAGPIRNRTMAQNAEGLVAVWDGKSKGTFNMIGLAREYGLRTFVLRTDTNDTEDYLPEAQLADMWSTAEERAAIKEYAGGVPRAQAEREAGIEAQLRIEAKPRERAYVQDTERGSDESFFRQLNAQIILNARSWICDRTVGIYRRMSEGDPVLEGSGVLLQIADAGFVMSAGHVLSAVEESSVFLGPMSDGARLIHVLTPIQISTDADLEDVGFSRLQPEVSQQLTKSGKKFLRLNEVAPGLDPEPGLYSVVGYPKVGNTPDYVTKIIDVTPFSYGTYLYESTVDNFRPGTSIAVKWTNRTITKGGKEERMPFPGGISGCGIWRLYEMQTGRRIESWDPSWIRLAGIEHRVSTGKWIKGTLVACVLRLIRQQHPDLRRSMDIAL